MNNDDKKVAVVTGGGKGIGEAICRSLSNSGFHVGIHYNASSNAAERLHKELPNSFLIQANLSTSEGVDAIYNTIKNEHSGQIDVLVNNAGLTIDNPIFSAGLDDFDSIVALNMKTTWYLTKRLSRFMIRKKAGRIINISSVVGSTGNPTQSIYGMTKAAIDNFTKTAAAEFASYNILINAVAPGFIATDMTNEIPVEFQEKIMERIPLGRMGKPEEVAQVVNFLATSGSYITGSVLHVNGGMYGG